MFISRLNNYLERIDPYYTQRIILRKGLYLAVWLTFINWLAKPDVFTAYATSAAFLVGFYELQDFNTYAKKDEYLVVSYLLSGIGCVCFYLLFPYKFFLLIFAIAFYLVAFFLSNKYYPQFRSRIMQVIMVSALNMTIKPQGNLQIACDMFFCVMLSLMVVFIALKFHNNLYPQVWYRAYKLYLTSIDKELSDVINGTVSGEFRMGATHLNIIRAFKHLQPKKMLFARVRTTVYIRQLSFAFMHIKINDANRDYFKALQMLLQGYLKAVKMKVPYPWLLDIASTNDQNQVFMQNVLKKAIHSWNKLCLTM